MLARFVLLTTVLACAAAVLCGSASAAPTLTVQQAKALAAKKADKVRRQMKSDGADRATVPGCWRNNQRQVSCFLSVYGHDPDLGDWQCMLRMVVKMRDPSGHGYQYKYGHAVCG